jgi:hypothetical protein
VHIQAFIDVDATYSGCFWNHIARSRYLPVFRLEYAGMMMNGMVTALPLRPLLDTGLCLPVRSVVGEHENFASGGSAIDVERHLIFGLLAYLYPLVGSRAALDQLYGGGDCVTSVGGGRKYGPPMPG